MIIKINNTTCSHRVGDELPSWCVFNELVDNRITSFAANTAEAIKEHQLILNISAALKWNNSQSPSIQPQNGPMWPMSRWLIAVKKTGEHWHTMKNFAGIPYEIFINQRNQSDLVVATPSPQQPNFKWKLFDLRQLDTCYKIRKNIFGSEKVFTHSKCKWNARDCWQANRERSWSEQSWTEAAFLMSDEMKIFQKAFQFLQLYS